jgi:hypothetical protein
VVERLRSWYVLPIQGVPLATEPGISLIILTPMKILQRNFEQEYVRCVRNEEECVCSVCLFRCNIFIGARIIKEISGSVASGTYCSNSRNSNCSVDYFQRKAQLSGFSAHRDGSPSQ